MALMTTRDVAERLAISERHVQELAQSGELPAVRIGRLWRFRAEAVQSYEDRNTTAQSDATPKVAMRQTVSHPVLTALPFDAPRNPVFPAAWGLEPTAISAAAPAAGRGRASDTKRTRSARH